MKLRRTTAACLSGLICVASGHAEAACDPSVPGNSEIMNPANCRVKAAEANGIILGLRPDAAHTIDPAKVPQCTAIGANIMKRASVSQRDYIASVGFGSTFTFEGRCASVQLECQVLDTRGQESLNRTPWGSASLRCGASPDRFAEIIRTIAPAVPAATVKSFAAACITAARARKEEGPTDREAAGHLLICDPSHPDGVTVRVEPRLE